jgi:hypothetical protein
MMLSEAILILEDVYVVQKHHLKSKDGSRIKAINISTFNGLLSKSVVRIVEQLDEKEYNSAIIWQLTKLGKILTREK